MKNLPSLKTKLRKQLKKIYSIESQLIGAFLLMRDKANSPELLNTFMNQQKIKKHQRSQLKVMGTELNISYSDCRCESVEKMIEKAISLITDNLKTDERDRKLIADAHHIYEYEITACKNAIKLAKALKLNDVVKKLKTFTEQEQTGDMEFNSIAQTLNKLGTSKPIRFAK